MNAEATKETLEFQTETQQLLHLMIHSLYSHKEIFLRELISNASDAADKLRFEAVSDDALYEGDSELKIRISFDKEANTLTITDNGIGMNRQEVIDNIGTIASSGTKKFVESLSGDEAKDSNMIGQFGVGFYSSYIVADHVTVNTRRAGTPKEEGVCWESEGTGSFTLEIVERETHGTEIILHMREEGKEFLDGWQIRNVITKYSDHIPYPIVMLQEAVEEGKEAEDETVNKASALWMRSKSEISDEEYNEFYKTVSHDFQEPLVHLHNHVEGTQSYTSLLYLPKKAPFDLWDREQVHGIKLYVRRVFIMDDAKELMPRYLRFVRGVIDSADLPLNVSREILQKNKVIDSIRSASVKRILKDLAKMAKKEPEKYAEFWSEFGAVMKEGPAEDFANKEEISKLLRYTTTNSEGDAQDMSLEDYVDRMQTGQEKIYYISADSLAAARNSPHLEVFRKRGIEVLLMHDRVDEWLMGYLTEFDGKSFQSVAKGALDLDDEESKEDKEKIEEASKDLIERIKTALGENVSDVRVSHRLTDSPSCLVMEEQDMAMHMQRLMKEAGHELPNSKPILEVNPDHSLVKRLDAEKDDAAFGELSSVLFDQAMLAEGGQLEDPASFVKRINQLLAGG